MLYGLGGRACLRWGDGAGASGIAGMAKPPGTAVPRRLVRNRFPVPAFALPPAMNGGDNARREGRARKVCEVYSTAFTGGIVHVPLMIEGSSVLGQYMRSMRMNLSFGAGSQLDSLSAPGDSFWM